MPTSRERVLAALAHQETDRVPIAMGFGLTDEAAQSLAAYLGLSSAGAALARLWQYADLRQVLAPYSGRRSTVQGMKCDEWGIGYRRANYGSGTYEEIGYSPLARLGSQSELCDYAWPDPAAYDVEDMLSQIARHQAQGEPAIALYNIAKPFELTWQMRGLERTYFDLVDQPELIYDIVGRITDVFIAVYRRAVRAARGSIDIVFTADDIGGQNGMLISLRSWEQCIKPHHKRMNAALHELGVKVMYHSDGSVVDAIPGLIDMGIDILEALQCDAKGMDPTVLKEQFGDRLCFHGGVSVQSTLPFGTVEDVRREVLERIAVLGRNGGYLLAPSHAIQVGTPPANMLAMFETAQAFRTKR